MRTWTTKLVWFALGLLVAGVLTFASPSRSQNAYQKQIDDLNTRVKALEDWKKEMTKPDRTRE